jgi:hypothetical protein
MDDLQTLLHKLDYARLELHRFLEDEADIKIGIAEMIAESQAGQALTGLQATIAATNDIVANLEADIRKLAVEMFDGENKQVHPAVGVGEYTVMEFDDDEALRYCVDHQMYSLLKLNVSAFTKAAKAGIFEFVLETKQLRAKIASDLSQYL